MAFIGVIPQDLAAGALWPQIGGLLARALPYGRGEYELDDIRAAIEGGRMFAIGVVDDAARVEFAAACSLIVYPRKRVLYVVVGAGRGAARTGEALLSAAATLGADWIETRCRTQVAALYRRYGFDTAYCVPIMEIT